VILYRALINFAPAGFNFVCTFGHAPKHVLKLVRHPTTRLALLRQVSELSVQDKSERAPILKRSVFRAALIAH
jgi:hypothetical protein